MPRGGYQKPSKPAAVSGVGKNSKRTDGGVQPVREPDIDQVGLEYGDRQMIADAQRVAPLPKGQKLPAERMPQGSVATGGKLPDWLIDGETNRSAEPVTTGLGLGPGAGPEALQASAPAPDLREEILEGLWLTFQNEHARQELQRLRSERMTPAPLPGAPMEATLG